MNFLVFVFNDVLGRWLRKGKNNKKGRLRMNCKGLWSYEYFVRVDVFYFIRNKMGINIFGL